MFSTYSQFLTKQVSAVPLFTYVSLFSGAGIGDFGLKLAGGRCLAACEIDPHRKAVHEANIGARVWGNLCTDKEELVKYLNGVSPDLLIATPPCQSFSTSNARRGMREDTDHASRDNRNSLFFEALEVARNIRPKIIFFENVPNFLKRKIKSKDGKVSGRVEEFLIAALSDYTGWTGVLCFSELGLPQRRRRSIAIFVRKDEHDSAFDMVSSPLKWPGRLGKTPKNIIEAIQNLPILDGSRIELACDPDDILHQVPHYTQRHYRWISDIPPASGRSSWENHCANCADTATPIFSVVCVKCGENMLNRPHVELESGAIRPIKGFKTSYTRMAADTLAPTMTTASSHFSSDIKLHPTQNRVLSARECAIIQAIPKYFKWPKPQHFRKGYLIREMIGEAVPSLVTYRFGLAIIHALGRQVN